MSFPGCAIGLFALPTVTAPSTSPVSTFDPKSIPGILGWYKADAGVILNGSNISSWQDQSGNNNHLVQTDTASQPTLINNALNNLPAVKFNSSFLNFTTGLATQTFSVFCIFKPNTEGGSQTILGSSGGGFQYCAASNGQFCNKTFVVFMGGDSTPIPADKFNQINVRYDSTNLNFRLNKSAGSAINYPTNFGNPSVSVAGKSVANNSEFFKGHLIELLIYPALPLEQIQQVEDYLASRMSVIAPTNPTTTVYKDAVLADKPIAYWRLGETNGTTAADISGNSNNGAYIGGYTLSVSGSLNGDSDKAVTFDGLTGYVQTSKQYSSPQIFSIKARFKTTGNTGQGLLHFGDSIDTRSVASDRNLYLSSDGKLNFFVFSSGSFTITSSKAYNDGNWHSAVATLSSSGVELYVDGELAASSTTPTSGHNYTGYWHIGYVNMGSGANYYFNGTLDEVAIYDTRLSETRIKAHYNAAIATPEQDPYFDRVVLLSHFDGANNSVAFTDVKGKTITPFGNAVISTAQSKFGGSSVYFDGSGDYLSIPLSADLQFGSGDLTWEAWVRPLAVTPNTYMTIFGNALGRAAGNAGLFLSVYNSQFVFRHWLNGNSNAVSSQTIQANTWYYVAVTKTGTALNVYVDGIKGSTGSTSLTNQDNNFTIGTTLQNDGFATDYSGYIDELRLTKAVRYTQNFTVSNSPFPNN